MKELFVSLLFVGCLALAGWTIYHQTKATPVDATVGEESDEITLLNTETGEISRSEWLPTPAVDPKTGKSTLVQGMYCNKCQKWYPAPPREAAERTPGGPVCYRDQTRLSLDGPLTSNQARGG